ncbi:ABC transporter ATP-binding protein [Litorihabitans aurantiacus]|uniref:Multidrug ABC transporter ATP-binding protein n=1 Tax=Litorihabitans aurantiacus TaxID=1930061 RepID=A0AA37XH43_9MICO|nr:ABC transporter ATP-binding protein [Litorihabitans aurantiacus]GMA32615.1 multidrug ABC transporter ATP-binding protein [Litorihabitans aurantiacus]
MAIPPPPSVPPGSPPGQVPATASSPGGGAPPALHAASLRRAFGPMVAVADASLALAPGSVTALVGPNGSGKTTLLLMLAGLLTPDAGEIRVHGMTYAEHGPDARRRVGWMPDTFGTWDSLTCTEVLTTFGAAYRLPAEVARERALGLLQTVHLAEYATAPAHVLSRGQKQRLGMARALIHAPGVLLLDEPASGLDPRSRVDLRRLVRSLADSGVAVLVSSHVLVELDEMVDDAVFINRGATVVGSPAPAMARWRLTTLDAAALTSWASSVNLPLAADPDEAPVLPGAPSAGTFVVSLPDESQAAALLRDAVRAGVPISRMSPAGGRLEQTYLAMETDRR